MAVAATAFIAVLLVLTALNAGALWRDETNSINIAQIPSRKQFWDYLRFESFPALWMLILRGWSFLGLANSDLGIRGLGLGVGLLFLGSLWICSRLTRICAPILSLALLGSMPAFINIVGANRAYGLALCLLVLTFGTLWWVVESPSRPRITWAVLVSILFLHCLYYDAIFLCAMLFGAALVVVRRREWKTLATLIGIGAVAGGTLVIYLPIIRAAPPYSRMVQLPLFDSAMLWMKLSQAVTAQSSAHYPERPGPEVWLWVSLLVLALVLVVEMHLRRMKERNSQNTLTCICSFKHNPADLALFCGASMLCGTLAYLGFVLRLRFPTEPWYYTAMLVLCAISLDGIISAKLPGFHPGGLLRVGFLFLTMTWGAKSVWEEAHTQRTNVNLIAAMLGKLAKPGDLILVHGPWEGITFERYYCGKECWMTLPPIDSHEVHRNDLIYEKLVQPDPMSPVLSRISQTLQKGDHVWVTGHLIPFRPRQILTRPPPPPNLPTKWWLGPYLDYWGAQVMAQLRDQGCTATPVAVPADRPINYLENLQLLRFERLATSAQ